MVWGLILSSACPMEVAIVWLFVLFSLTYWRFGVKELTETVEMRRWISEDGSYFRTRRRRCDFHPRKVRPLHSGAGENRGRVTSHEKLTGRLLANILSETLRFEIPQSLLQWLKSNRILRCFDLWLLSWSNRSELNPDQNRDCVKVIMIILMMMTAMVISVTEVTF